MFSTIKLPVTVSAGFTLTQLSDPIQFKSDLGGVITSTTVTTVY